MALGSGREKKHPTFQLCGRQVRPVVPTPHSTFLVSLKLWDQNIAFLHLDDTFASSVLNCATHVPQRIVFEGYADITGLCDHGLALSELRLAVRPDP